VKWLFGDKGKKRGGDKSALDERTLQQLGGAGANLTKPTDVVNYLLSSRRRQPHSS
jgi:hypothetical protein